MHDKTYVVGLAKAVADTVRPMLDNAMLLRSLGEVTEDKGGGHTAHRVDQVAEQSFFDRLSETGYRGAVFSEEAGLVRLGDEPRLLICDPFCNTSLTFRGVRESAVSVYEYTPDGLFVAAAIADIQIPRIVWAAGDQPAQVSSANPTESTAPARTSSTARVSEAFLTLSLLKRNRRADPPTALIREAQLLTTIDGGIVAARIAVGELDGFVDDHIGQPAYEALAYELVVRAGGTVSDGQGRPVDFGGIAARLGQGQTGRQTIVAAGNAALHHDIMEHLSTPAPL